MLVIIGSLSNYNYVAKIRQLNVKKQSILSLIATAVAFTIFPTTHWLIARYGFRDSFSIYCYVMLINIHNFCLALCHVGKYIGFQMKWSEIDLGYRVSIKKY